MEKLTSRLVIGVILFLLTACATVKDVQRASDLIRTDNELTRLIVEVRPSDPTAAAIYLSAVAAHAKREATALKGHQDKILDAIAYYRIAATAYWRSGRTEVVSDLFEVTDNGTKLCSDLGQNAPDRDCLFLQLVIPFAGLESILNQTGLPNLFKSINFNDGNASPAEIDTMTKIHETLVQTKLLVLKILAVGEDNRFLSHPGMREYYCKNATTAVASFDSCAGAFSGTVRVFHDKFPDPKPPLGITLDEAREIRNLKGGVPDFCR